MKIKINFISKLFFSPFSLTFIGLGILIFSGMALFEQLNQRYAVNQEKINLEKEIKAMEAKNKDLSRLVGYLQSDDFVESQARLNFGLKKPGEGVVVVTKNDKKDKLEKDLIITENKNNPQRWADYFFK